MQLPTRRETTPLPWETTSEDEDVFLAIPNKRIMDRTLDIFKITHKCNLEQIDPFLKVKKSVFCDFLAIQKSNFDKLFFYFVVLDEFYKIEKTLFKLNHWLLR